jgi:hypothetical protein
MDLEQSEILKGLCNDLEKQEIICSECASKLKIATTLRIGIEFRNK